MKRISIVILLAVIVAAVASCSYDVLSGLWKNYEEASEADLPETMAETLEQIRKESFDGHHSWDYYDSSVKWLDVKTRRNWKLRNSLEKEVRDGLAAFGEPLLIWLYDLQSYDVSPDSLCNYIVANSVSLRKGHDEDVWSESSPFEADGVLRPFSDLLTEGLANDYEFALWSLRLLRSGAASQSEKVYGLLESSLNGRYPESAFLKYSAICRIYPAEDRKEELQEMLGRYDGRAAGLVAEQDLLELEFAGMEGKAGSEEYLAFRDRLHEFEKRRSSFKGQERRLADCCTDVKRMLDEMEAEALAVKVKDSEAEFCLRNTGRLRVQVLKDDEVVHEEWLYNERNSFYAYDTLRLALPALDDGSYVLKCSDGKKEIARCPYDKYTLSVAKRYVAAEDGLLKSGIYVADYKTGEPVESVDISLYSSKGKLVMQEKAVVLNGFTDVPLSLYKAMNPDLQGYAFSVSFRDNDGRLRRSGNIAMSKRRSVVPQNIEDRSRAILMLDRAAFNHGDTLRFKAVVYRSAADSMAVENGAQVTVELSDASGQVFGSKVFETNEFGSVSGEFVLDGVKRNGTCRIKVLKDGYEAGFARFVVDDHVLPTFELTFEPSDSLYLVGEEVTLRGMVKSYSGHSLQSAKMKYTVNLDNKPAYGGNLVPDSDGRFEITYKAEADEDRSYCWAAVTVTITDDTGETHSFRHSDSFASRLDPRAEVLNAVPSGVYMWPKHDPRDTIGRKCIVADDVLKVSCSLKSRKMSYSLRHEGRVVHEGLAASGDTLHLDMSGLVSGIYEFSLAAEGSDGYGRPVRGTDKIEVFLIRQGDAELPAKVSYMFRPLESGGISFQAASGDRPLWAVAELYGDDRRPLDGAFIRVCGASGEERDLVSYDLEYRKEYPDMVRLVVTGFRDGQVIRWEHEYSRQADHEDLMVNVVRMTDRTGPDTECTVALKTGKDVEILAAVFDKSTERIRRNIWPEVSGTYAYHNIYYDVYVHAVIGSDGSGGYVRSASESNMLKRAGYVSVEEESAEAIPFQLMDGSEVDAAAGAFSDVDVREDFSTTLAFEPFIRPDDSGMAELRFRTSDKLSTYVVSVFAHDKDMNNAVLRREMLVTLPVKVSVSVPKLLYAGDRYVLNASVSSTSEKMTGGVLSLEVYDGQEYKDTAPLARYRKSLDVPAGGNAAAGFEMDVPSGVDTLGFKLMFEGGNTADAVFVTVPVSESAQTLLESHSAVLTAGMSRESLLDSLERSFVNVPAMGAEYEEIALSDLLKKALPVVQDSGALDLVSQCRALYVNLLGYGLHRNDGSDDEDELRSYAEAAMDCLTKILAYTRVDGGFSWLQGMKSSPVMTAYVLECFAGLRDRKLLDVLPEYFGEDALDDFDDAVLAAVAFLDKEFFNPSLDAQWSGSLTTWQYLCVRSMYVGVPFDPAKAEESLGKEKWKDFRKSVNTMLASGKGSAMTRSAVLEKVRMMRVMLALGGSEEGRRLASEWGVRKLERMSVTLRAELESLLEYAVEHPSGGWYYPNAVLPWRGLMESEVYAHSMICDLFRDMVKAEAADGIRLWIMLQKETQKWSSDPGYAAALASVYDASEAVMGTKILVMGKRYRKMFEDIEPSGNGMSVTVRYFRETPDDRREEINEGDVLKVGDKIIGVYSLWSQENRSFVRVSVPRPACLHPVDQLSGWRGGWLRLASGVHPYCYREVKPDRTVYWIDVFPEEDSVFEEELFVTQEGRFVSPVSEIESLYAPHYRANSEGGRKISAIF